MKQTKKGFTLVELLVVIAILAILATVSVVGYTAFIQRAHESNDIQLLQSLNTLILDKRLNNELETPHDAFDFVRTEGGVDLGKFHSKIEGCEILWDNYNKIFCYLNSEGNIQYVPESVPAVDAQNSDLWIISETVHATYSTYYVGTSNISTDASTSICLATDGSDLVINAPNANVIHYGEVSNLTIEAVASNSYHEHGSVTGLATVKSGRIVVENGGSIAQIVVTSTSVSLEGKFGVVMGTSEVLESLGDVDGNKAVVENMDALETAEAYNETSKLFCTLEDAFSAEGTVRLLKDINITSDIGYTIKAGQQIVLDLNGHVLTQFAGNAKRTALIDNKGTLTIKDTVGGGKIVSSALNPDTQEIPTYASNTITNTGTLVLESGTIENQTDASAAYCVDDQGKFTMNGGALIAARCALRVAKYNIDNVEFVLNNGTITAPTPAWIQLPGSSADAAPTIYVQINGGILQTTKPSSANNNVIYSYSSGNSHLNTHITINGGQFLGGTVSIGSGYKGDAPELTINGGTFEYDVLKWLANNEYSVLYEANK